MGDEMEWREGEVGWVKELMEMEGKGVGDAGGVGWER